MSWHFYQTLMIYLTEQHPQGNEFVGSRIVTHTRDSLYLALRLSALHNSVSGGSAPPWQSRHLTTAFRSEVGLPRRIAEADPYEQRGNCNEGVPRVESI